MALSAPPRGCARAASIALTLLLAVGCGAESGSGPQDRAGIARPATPAIPMTGARDTQGGFIAGGEQTVPSAPAQPVSQTGTSTAACAGGPCPCPAFLRRAADGSCAPDPNAAFDVCRIAWQGREARATTRLGDPFPLRARLDPNGSSWELPLTVAGVDVDLVPAGGQTFRADWPNLPQGSAPVQCYVPTRWRALVYAVRVRGGLAMTEVADAERGALLWSFDAAAMPDALIAAVRAELPAEQAVAVESLAERVAKEAPGASQRAPGVAVSLSAYADFHDVARWAFVRRELPVQRLFPREDPRAAPSTAQAIAEGEPFAAMGVWDVAAQALPACEGAACTTIFDRDVQTLLDAAAGGTLCARVLWQIPGARWPALTSACVQADGALTALTTRRVTDLSALGLPALDQLRCDWPLGPN